MTRKPYGVLIMHGFTSSLDYDTNYAWAPTDAPESAQIIYEGISTPPDQKRIVWFEVTEHEMFRDCERGATIRTVVDYVRERAGLAG